MFDSHHGVIAQMLLNQVAFLDQRITAMEDQAIAALAQVEESWGVDATGETERPTSAPARTRRCWPQRTGWPRSPASACGWPS